MFITDKENEQQNKQLKLLVWNYQKNMFLQSGKKMNNLFIAYLVRSISTQN